MSHRQTHEVARKRKQGLQECPRHSRAKKVDRMQLVIPHCHGCEHPAPEHVDFV